MKTILRSSSLWVFAALLLWFSLTSLRPLNQPETGSTSASQFSVTESSPSGSPGASASAASDACGSAFLSLDRMDPTIAARAEGSIAVAAVTIVDIEDAVWSTKDGAAPTIRDGVPADDSYIYRTVILRVDHVVKGNPQPEVMARQIGGQVGCYSYAADESTVLHVGSRYVVFLGPTPSTTGAWDKTVLTLNDAWPIVGGMAVTPLDGTISIEDFSLIVANAPRGPFDQLGSAP